MASMATCFTLPPNPRRSLLFKPIRFTSPLLKPPEPRIFSISAAVRPGGSVESDSLPSDVRKRAMEAVDACGPRVTVGDVAGRAGLHLIEAQRALQALSSDTHGFLEVSNEGDVLYVFPQDYRAKLVGKSFIMRVEPLLDKAKDVVEYLARVSFGTALIVSIVLVFTAIVVAVLALVSSAKSTDSDSDSSRSNQVDISSFSRCCDEVFWYWDPKYYQRQQGQTRIDDGNLKFGESFFSFVFGDGDPNKGIEEERWKLIGQYISSNGGVVAAEELAPYLDTATSGETLSDEAYIFPVLLRYEGQPLIDEEGNILYQFPSLQRTASQMNERKKYVGTKEVNSVGGGNQFLREVKWQFSKTSIAKRAMVVGLGGLNLFGVVFLRCLLKDPTVAQIDFIKFISRIFPILQIYACSYFVIPLFRWFVMLKTNADIEKRNQARQQFARDLELPDLSLRKKLVSARDLAQKMVIGQEKIVYSTERDMDEQYLQMR